MVMVAVVGTNERECPVATNPFEDPDAKYLVLINDEGQHSLWPVFADVPDGWEVIFGQDGRQECLDFIEKNWTDMRPNSLIRQMEADAAARQGSSTGNGTSGNGSAASQNPNGSRAPKKEAAGKK
jgi:MbtH protein